MTHPVLYVIVNGELKMSPGKTAAQVAHAVAGLKNVHTAFGKYHERTVIVLEADNTQQVLALHRYLRDAGTQSYYYIDEGHNEVPAYSVTALAVAPMLVDDPARDALKMFSLYPKKRGWF